MDILLLTWIYLLKISVVGSLQSNAAPPERRRLRIVTIQMPPYVSFLFDPLLIGNERYQGYYIDYIQELSRVADFDYQFRLVGDGQIGRKIEEPGGGWNGMVGDIYREEADLAVGPISVTKVRTDIIEFTNPLRQQTIACIQRNIEGLPLWDSIDEALSQPHLKFGVVSNSEIKYFLRGSKDGIFKRIYERVRDSHGYAYPESTFEALEILRRRNDYVLLMEEESAEYYINKNPCDLHILDRLETGMNLAFAVKNNSRLIADINNAMERVNAQESLLRRLNRKWWPRDCWGGTQEEGGTADYGGESEVSVESQSGSQPMRLTFTTMVNEPYFKFSPEDGVFYEGYIVDLVHHLGQIVPFEHRWMVQTGYGKETQEGTRSGMIGDLLSGVADIAAAPFTVNRKASEFLTYTKPFHHSSIAILVSEHTFEHNPILYMEDLLNDTNTQIGVIKGSRIERLFRKSRMPVYQDIWKKIIREGVPVHPRRHGRRSRKRNRNNIVDSLATGINKVRSRNYALLLDSAQANYITSLPPCDLVASDQFTDIANFGFALKKDNALAERIDEALMQIQQDGVLQMLFHKWWMGGECFETTDRNHRLLFNETRAPVIVVADDLPHHRFAEEPFFESTTTTTTTTTMPSTSTTSKTTTTTSTTTTAQSSTATLTSTTASTSTKTASTSTMASTSTTLPSSIYSSTLSSALLPAGSLEHVESHLDTGQMSTTILNPPIKVPNIHMDIVTESSVNKTTLNSDLKSENSTISSVTPSHGPRRHNKPRRKKKNRKTTTDQSAVFTVKPGKDNGDDWFVQTGSPRLEEEYELLNETVNHGVYNVFSPKQTSLNGSNVLVGESVDNSVAVKCCSQYVLVYVVYVLIICIGI